MCHRYGDCLRSGWRDILDCTVRLHKLGLLPPAVLRADGESADAAAQRMPKPSMPPRTGSSGVLYRAFTRCRDGTVVDFADAHDLLAKLLGTLCSEGYCRQCLVSSLAKWCINNLAYALLRVAPQLLPLTAPLPDCSLISIDGTDPAASDMSQRDTEAIGRTRDCVEGCRIDEVWWPVALLLPCPWICLVRWTLVWLWQSTDGLLIT